MAKIAPSGVALPFEYTSYDGQPGKFIGMTVFDVTSGVPVQVNPVPIPMPHAFQGTYIGYFTPDPSKSYVVHKMVYTDGTFATVNNNYSPGSESFTTIYGSLLDQIWNFDISAVIGPVASGFVLYTLPTASTIAAAVWNALRATFNAVGSFGEALQGVLSPARADNLDNLDVPVSSVSGGSSSLADLEFVVGTVESEEEIIGVVENI